MKEQILKLRSEGKKYNEIAELLGCSKSLIAYYVNDTTKKAFLKKQKENRFQKRFNIKQKHGGCCSICGYKKCLAALQFHHTDPKTKLFNITDAIWGKGGFTLEEIDKEAEKCVLLCANCHFEIHNYHE